MRKKIASCSQKRHRFELTRPEALFLVSSGCGPDSVLAGGQKYLLLYSYITGKKEYAWIYFLCLLLMLCFSR